MPKRYKKPADEAEKRGKESAPAPVKKAKVKSSKPMFKGFREGLDKWKVAPVTGLFLIVFSICILLAFTSFLFTWKIDYALPPKQSANWLGYFGRVLSDFFINGGFGVASFGFVLIVFLTGVKLLIKRDLLPFGKTFRITLFLIVWVSVCLGFFFPSGEHTFMGGEVGLISSDKIIMLIGKTGTLIALAFIAMVFLLINNLMTLPVFSPKTESDEEEMEEDIMPTVEIKQPDEVHQNTIIESF